MWNWIVKHSLNIVINFTLEVSHSLYEKKMKGKWVSWRGLVFVVLVWFLPFADRGVGSRNWINDEEIMVVIDLKLMVCIFWYSEKRNLLKHIFRFV